MTGEKLPFNAFIDDVGKFAREIVVFKKCLQDLMHRW